MSLHQDALMGTRGRERMVLGRGSLPEPSDDGLCPWPGPEERAALGPAGPGGQAFRSCGQLVPAAEPTAAPRAVSNGR